MDCEAAAAALGALEQILSVRLTAEDEDRLVSQSLVRRATEAERVASLSDLRMLEGSMEMPRAVRTPDEARHVARIAQLRTSVHTLARNELTGHWLGLASLGRRLLADLRARLSRVRAHEVFDFLREMEGLRRGLEATVGRASVLLSPLEDEIPNLPPSILRPWAILLARLGPNAPETFGRFRRYMAELQPYANGIEARVGAAAVLAATPGDTPSVLARFRALLPSAESRSEGEVDSSALAASMSDVDPTVVPTVLARFDAIRGARVAKNGLLVAGLARSTRAPKELADRFFEIRAQLLSRGYADSPDLNTAAALLAGEDLEADVEAHRFSQLASNLHGLFPSPYVPAALLAISDLDPAESFDVFNEAAAAISRKGFFDGTVEVVGLALMMVEGLGVPLMGTGFPRAEQAPSSGSGLAFGRRAIRYYGWDYWWLSRSIRPYVLTHPLHIHAAPAFG